MRLMGCSRISDIKREMVITTSLNAHQSNVEDALTNQTYVRLKLPMVGKL